MVATPKVLPHYLDDRRLKPGQKHLQTKLCQIVQLLKKIPKTRTFLVKEIHCSRGIVRRSAPRVLKELQKEKKIL